MKCNKCNYSNPDNSIYCAECGTKLSSGSNKAPSNKGWGWGIAWILSILIFFFILFGAGNEFSEARLLLLLIDFVFGVVAFILMLVFAFSNSSSSKSTIIKPSIHNTRLESKYSKLLDDEVSDVIFKPKKRSNSVVWILLTSITFVIILGLILVNQSPSDPTVQERNANSEIQQDSVFPIYYLSIDNTEGDWIGNQFYIKGTIKNDHSLLAKDIRIRVDFTKNKDGTGLFDTRFITIPAVPANGAYSFKEPVYINEPPTQNWWWNMQIISVDEGT